MKDALWKSILHHYHGKGLIHNYCISYAQLHSNIAKLSLIKVVVLLHVVSTETFRFTMGYAMFFWRGEK